MVKDFSNLYQVYSEKGERSYDAGDWEIKELRAKFELEKREFVRFSVVDVRG
jgi:hypothetical protein